MSTITHTFTDYCPGPELMWDEEREVAFRDLIRGAFPESTTGCMHGPGEPCMFVTVWLNRQAAALPDLLTHEEMLTMTLGELEIWANERGVTAGAVCKAIEDAEAVAR